MCENVARQILVEEKKFRNYNVLVKLYWVKIK